MSLGNGGVEGVPRGTPSGREGRIFTRRASPAARPEFRGRNATRGYDDVLRPLCPRGQARDGDGDWRLDGTIRDLHDSRARA
jgi:hypothetical protein